MIYQMYQSHTDLMDPLRWMARHSSAALSLPWGLGQPWGGDLARKLSSRPVWMTPRESATARSP